MLFTVLVVSAFIAWLAASLDTRAPEWVARALFLAAAVVWAL